MGSFALHERAKLEHQIETVLDHALLLLLLQLKQAGPQCVEISHLVDRGPSGKLFIKSVNLLV